MDKIKEKDLENVTGGEPEEFEWETKGYVTPIKEDNNKGWKYEAVNSNIEEETK